MKFILLLLLAFPIYVQAQDIEMPVRKLHFDEAHQTYSLSGDSTWLILKIYSEEALTLTIDGKEMSIDPKHLGQGLEVKRSISYAGQLSIDVWESAGPVIVFKQKPAMKEIEKDYSLIQEVEQINYED